MIYLRELVAGALSPWVVLSPTRFSRQLRRFAHTELYTHFDIGAVAARQDEAELRAEMERHAADEYRHYRIFREWAARVAPYSGANYGDPGGTRDAASLDAATVRAATLEAAAPSLRFGTLGEYMTYLFLSESRAVLQFRLTWLLNLHDERCRRQIPALLVDERRHVRYSLRYALRELRRSPGLTLRGWLRVAGYVLRQDLVDLLSVVQRVGSAVIGGLLYALVVTPYALLLRALGSLRRGALRPRGEEAPVLDETFWRRSG